MRSREEQIADLTNLFGEEGTFSFVDDRDAATKHIIEAERRAERRVQAEIARDSERLDWLERTFILMALVKGPTPVALDKPLDAVFTQTGGISFRSYIDAAREAQG